MSKFDNFLHQNQKLYIKALFLRRESIGLIRRIITSACNESHGERAIRDYLIEHDILFISQYTIGDCKDIRVLKFDFAVFHEDGFLRCLIEYDGGQHFYPVMYFGGEKGF